MNNNMLLDNIRTAAEKEEQKRNIPVLEYNINDIRNNIYSYI